MQKGFTVKVFNEKGEEIEAKVDWVEKQIGGEVVEIPETFMKNSETPTFNPNILKLIEENQQGIKLDVGCGHNPQEGFITLDIRPIEEVVDIIHDAESIPYPLPDECCGTILASHLVEHLCPKRFTSVMNEWWRLMKPRGQLLISAPYGRSDGMLQDPSHCNFLNEATFTYFDPQKFLYQIYKPKPWDIIENRWMANGNLEVILEKIEDGSIELL